MTKPHLFNLAAEAAVLGAVLFENRAYEVLSEIVRADCFYPPAHQLLWKRIGAMIEAGQTADGITLESYAANTPEVAEVGGAAYVFELLESAALGMMEAKDYARQIADYAVRRRMIELSRSLEARAISPEDGQSCIELLTLARQEIDEIESDGLGGSAVWENSDAENTIVDRQDDVQQVVGVRTGISELDKKLGPMRPGQLIVLGGRPGMAKTGVARNIAENVARTGAVVAFAQLEMSREELEVRSASSIARKNGEVEVPYEDIIDGVATPQQRSIISRARRLIPKSLWIMSEGNLSVDRLAASLLALRRSRGRLDLVELDYLQIMGITRERGQNDASAIGAATRALKQLAKKMQVPIIVLSQVNRAVESRENKRPMLSDLRESGAIEQDADVVMFVFREEYYLKQEEPANGSAFDWDEWRAELGTVRGRIEIIIAKKRMGRVGTATLHYEETTDTLVSTKAELTQEVLV